MQSETKILAAASLTSAEKMENTFDSMLNDATENYKTFLESGFEDDIFKISVLINFKELFEVCLDIKKKEMTAAPAVDGEQSNASIGSVPPVPEMGEKPAKVQRRK